MRAILRAKPMLLVLALCLATPAGAQVFRWTDKEGRVHYGDDVEPNARNAREVTATVNTLDTSGLRQQAGGAQSFAKSSGGGGGYVIPDPSKQQKAQAAPRRAACGRRC